MLEEGFVENEKLRGKTAPQCERPVVHRLMEFRA